ncbi:MAG: helix-turn-helix domain-containing protein [Firmicutes bacterium]|nr:helix-turn-helix domain-containing protein [Bacillota bacterium]
MPLPYRKLMGSRIRVLREQRGWSQSKTAQQIPLSQKQFSRLELGDVAIVDRRLLIRLAEIFETPIRSGEVNQWLHAFGYRPHMLPLLPLPENAANLLAHYAGLPAVIWDMGRYIRFANAHMEGLLRIRIPELRGLKQNWLWQYFHEDGFLRPIYAPDSAERVLNRLFWDWEPYYLEPWNVSLRRQLESALDLTWEDVQAQYHIPSEPLSGPWSETVTVVRGGAELMFRGDMAEVPFRPDLHTIVYQPLNAEAEAWCRTFIPSGLGSDVPHP